MIKNYAIIFLIIISIVSTTSVYVFYNNNKQLKNSWSQSENNYKATLKKNIAYQLTIDQLKASNDSDDIKLLEFKNKLKIKDSKIMALMSMIEVGGKTDTIYSKDTLFVRGLKLDTIIGDSGISNRLQLEYPGKIIITDSITNKKNIAGFSKRETIEPPKKFFMCRGFQPKHTLVEITIEDLNPYFKTKEFKYNLIIK